MKISALTAACMAFVAASCIDQSEAATRYFVYPVKGLFGTATSSQAFDATKVKTVHMLPSIGARAVDVEDEADLVELLKNPAISHVEKDVQRFPLNPVINDVADTEKFLRRHLQTGEQVPYGVNLIGANKVPLASGTTRSKLFVCIIDSGINAAHPDLSTANIAGYGTAWRTDACGHGTHVAGTIAAVKGNGQGVVGVAPGVSVYSVQVFSGASCGYSWSSDLLSAIQKCRDVASAGAKIIVSMSLGGPQASAAEQSGFQSLYNSGILSIAAAGNDGTTGFSYPASYPSLISVAAIDSSRRVATFSQKNSQVDISAPGVGVLSTYKNSYSYLDGTSMATPHVSAAAALVWSYGISKGWTNADVRNALISTATDLGAAGRDNSYGAGLTNVCKAAKLAGFDPSNQVAC